MSDCNPAGPKEGKKLSIFSGSAWSTRSVMGGWFTLGRATATIDPELRSKNGIKYFNANLNAKTVGLLSFIKKY